MEPDFIVYLNLYIKPYGPQSINQNEQSNCPIKIYPNPINEDKILRYEISLPVNTLDTEMEIYSLKGELLLKSKIIDSIGTLDLSSLKAETYILNLITNKKDIYSTKITFTK